ncbi:tetratricopeptide repeat protein [Nannochloropsis oceanica]
MSSSIVAATAAGARDRCVLLRSLYRALSRHGKWFDATPVAKAVIPFPLPFSYQVLLGGHNRDFYGQRLSVQNAIRSGFDSAASGQVQTEMSEELRLDLTLQLARQIGGWRHLLSSSASGIPTSSSPSFSSSSSSSSTFITYQGVYAEARKHNLRLHRALEKLEEAERLLDEGGKDGGVVDREMAKCLYRESLALHPTADAHTYLAYLLSYEGAFEEAKKGVKEAMKLDKEFGNSWNDLGLYLWQEGEHERALSVLAEAKGKRRYESRYKPYLNCGHILLELGRPEEALVEYLHALHLAGPERGAQIRAVICDMAQVLTQKREEEGG